MTPDRPGPDPARDEIAALREAADNMPLSQPGQAWEGAATWLRRRAAALAPHVAAQVAKKDAEMERLGTALVHWRNATAAADAADGDTYPEARDRQRAAHRTFERIAQELAAPVVARQSLAGLVGDLELPAHEWLIADLRARVSTAEAERDAALARVDAARRDALTEAADALDRFTTPEVADWARPAATWLRARAAVESPDQTGGEMSTGTDMIAAERARQINVEGWTPEHDAAHRADDLAVAAVCYATPPAMRRFPLLPHTKVYGTPDLWPWQPRFWKPTPSDRVRELVKAGALIAAEIDRIRAVESPDQPKPCPNYPRTCRGCVQCRAEDEHDGPCFCDCPDQPEGQRP